MEISFNDYGPLKGKMMDSIMFKQGYGLSPGKEQEENLVLWCIVLTELKSC